MSVPQSQIEPGFYYEKKNTPGWLRLVVRVSGNAVTYADFNSYGRCKKLGQWASRRLSAEEAMKEFPDEVAKIAAVVAATCIFEYLP